MIDKPHLSEDAIRAGLLAGYGLPADGLAFLPAGNDSTAWAYRVEAAGGPFFLKLKRGPVSLPALRAPRFLNRLGIAEVVAPLPGRTGSLLHPLGDFHLILYPFVDGRTGMEQGLTLPQWAAFGRLARQIHAAPLPADLAQSLPRETFRPYWAQTVRQIQALVAGRRFDEPIRRELAEFWRARADQIEQITARAEALGRQMQAWLRAPDAPTLALCHADIHTANLLVTPRGELRLVDWDGTLLAPVERDLMFVASRPGPGALSGGPEQAHFFQGYGDVEVRALPLAYYRYEWVVQEIGDYGQRVFLAPDLGAETRRDALRGFIQLFDPGDVVEAANQSG